MQENAWVHSVRLPKLVALSSAPLSLSLTVSFVRAGKGRDETTIRRGVRREQHCNSATRRPHVLRGSALRRRQVGPRHPPAATRQETAAPQQVRPSDAEPARFAGNFFSPSTSFSFYCLQQQKDTRLPVELLTELRLGALFTFYLCLLFTFFLFSSS